MPLDIKKEFIKLKKEKARKLALGIILLVIGFPGFIITVLMGALYLTVFFMFAGFVGIALVLRTACHPNYYSLNREINGYDKCQQLHMVPPVGKNAELDLKIRRLEKIFYDKGCELLKGNLRADNMTPEDRNIIKNTITDLAVIDKATDEALFKCYAHLTSQANMSGLNKNKQAPIQKECVFRILYLRYYYLLNK